VLYLTFKLPLGLWTDSKIAVFIFVAANYNMSLVYPAKIVTLLSIVRNVKNVTFLF